MKKKKLSVITAFVLCTCMLFSAMPSGFAASADDLIPPREDQIRFYKMK